MSALQKTTASEASGVSAPAPVFTTPSSGNDLHFVNLTNNARPTMQAVKRTSRHMGSESPVDDIKEQLEPSHLGSSARHIRGLGLDFSQHSGLVRKTNSSVEHHNRPTSRSGGGSATLEPDPQRTFRPISADFDGKDREGMVFDYYPTDDAAAKDRESSPEPSSNIHKASQNSQAYDDVVDCASDGSSSSPHDIEMQTFRKFEIQEANDAQQCVNSQTYDEAHEPVDSDDELMSVKVEKPPESDSDSSSIHRTLYGSDYNQQSQSRPMSIPPANVYRTGIDIPPNFTSTHLYGMNRRYRQATGQTNVDTGVNFGLGGQKDRGVGGQPPFGDPVQVGRVHASAERLLGSRKSSSIERDLAAAGMPPAEAIDGGINQQSKKKKEKKGSEKGRKKETTGYDINGNPRLGPGSPLPGLLSRDVPQHFEHSSLASVSRSFQPYSSSKPSALDDSNDRETSSSVAGNRPRRKKQKKKEESVIKAEQISGHVEFESIDEALKFVNDGKVENSKEEESKQRRENGKTKSKRKGKKSKSESESEVQSIVGESVGTVGVPSGEQNVYTAAASAEDSVKSDDSVESSAVEKKVTEKKMTPTTEKLAPAKSVKETSATTTKVVIVHKSELKMAVNEPEENASMKLSKVSKQVVHESESPEAGKHLMEAMVKTSQQSVDKSSLSSDEEKSDAEIEEKDKETTMKMEEKDNKTMKLEEKDKETMKVESEKPKEMTPHAKTPPPRESENSLLLHSKEDNIMFTDFLVPSPPREEDFTVVTKGKKKKVPTATLR